MVFMRMKEGLKYVTKVFGEVCVELILILWMVLLVVKALVYQVCVL